MIYAMTHLNPPPQRKPIHIVAPNNTAGKNSQIQRKLPPDIIIVERFEISQVWIDPLRQKEVIIFGNHWGCWLASSELPWVTYYPRPRQGGQGDTQERGRPLQTGRWQFE